MAESAGAQLMRALHCIRPAIAMAVSFKTGAQVRRGQFEVVLIFEKAKLFATLVGPQAKQCTGCCAVVVKVPAGP